MKIQDETQPAETVTISKDQYLSNANKTLDTITSKYFDPKQLNNLNQQQPIILSKHNTPPYRKYKIKGAQIISISDCVMSDTDTNYFLCNKCKRVTINTYTRKCNRCNTLIIWNIN